MKRTVETAMWVFSAALLPLLLISCSPTVKVEAPDKPIVLKIDLNIKHEIQLKVEKDIENISFKPAIPLAKRAGWIGERHDGYLGLVKEEAPKDITELVLQANEERLAMYTNIAEKNKMPRSTVETIAGLKFSKKSAPGEYVMSSDKKWSRK
tara:strand:+ start:383 stop:838 length:456 start_codon:yes stop_codon:yes gene_type:complete